MGGGASKKTGDGQVLVATSVQVGARKEEDAAVGAAPEAPAAVSQAEPEVGAKSAPERPKAAQEVKRPRAGRKPSQRDEDGSGNEPGAASPSPSGSPSATRQVQVGAAAKPEVRPPLPRGPSGGVAAIQKEVSKPLDDEDDDEEEAVRQPKPARPPRQPPRPASEEPASPHTPAQSEKRTPAPPAGGAPTPTRAAAPVEASPKAAGSQVLPKSPERPRDLKPEEFIAACRAGDENSVQAYLMHKARTSKGLSESEESLFDAYGDSVLHHAVQGGNPKVVQLLLEMGKVQVDIPNARNETALQIACRKGDPDMVHVLLEAQADPDRRDAGGLTPFLSAVFACSNKQVLEQLSKAQASVGAQDARGVGALHFAALRGDSTLMDWLLMRKASPDAQTEHRTTPLMLAAKRGHTDGVSLLLGCRANSSLADEAGCTALMHALSGGNEEAAKKLLDSGASVDAVDCAGRSPLFHAVLGGKVSSVCAVIARGGRVNVLDEEGRSPLYQACLMSQFSIAKTLLEGGADPNLAGRGSSMRAMRPQDGEAPEEEEEDRDSCAARACLEEARTCLQACATLAHNDLLTCLLEHGADINAAPGALGWSALHLCAVVSNEEGASLLLARGAVVQLEDAEGNTAAALAERAGHESVLNLLKEAEAAAPEMDAATAAVVAGAAPTPSAARRNMAMKGMLPPLHAANSEEAPPEEDHVPLSTYQEEWEQRGPDGSLLDRVIGPMVHDALRSDQWRLRWEACSYLSTHFSEVAGSPSDVVIAVSTVLGVAARDKMPKVLLAALAVFEELLSDARADVLGPEEFAALLRGKPLDQADGGGLGDSAGPGVDAIVVLLDQTDAGGGSSAASSPQQAAADALCSCVLHGRVPLDEVAWPLLSRIDERLRLEAAGEKDRKDKALAPKCLAVNLKLLGRLLSAFGLQQSGLFRRALVLPLLLRAAASEHSKARAAAGDAVVQLMALSGGMEDRLWQILPSKARKALQRLASTHEGLSLISVVPCEEDAMRKDVIVSEDARAGAFVCVSELSPQVWAQLAAGGEVGQEEDNGSAGKSRSGKSGHKSRPAGGGDDPGGEAIRTALTSKNWKERAEGLAAMAQDLAIGDGVKLLEEEANGDPSASGGGACAGGPLLSQYVLRGHRISTLQAMLSTLLADSVTQVFVAAADLLRVVCVHVPLYIAPLFLEPLLPPLVARLLDSSGRVRTKATETILEVASLHGGALAEMIAQCVASGSAWNAPPPTAGGSAGASSSGDRAAGRDHQTGPRLQLLTQLVTQLQAGGSSGRWTEETWQALADYAVRAGEHKSGDVRKEASALIAALAGAGGSASAVAERANQRLQALAQSSKIPKRPGTTARPPTGANRMSTAAGSRPGTGAQGFNSSGRLSNMGSTGFNNSGRLSTMGSTGRLSTASRRTGTSFRPSTSSLRPGTGLSRNREMDEESDNSVTSEPRKAEVPDIDGAEAGEGEVQFFDVQTACPGADQVPTMEEGDQALREALPLAEALDEVALDFVAPLIALFGDGWTRCFYSRQWQCRVAALTHLSASMAQRLEEISGPEASPNALGELLDGAMRAVHEGLGDQNVRVYAEACMAVTAVVPAFCGAVDGRLLVAHLAPLLRQLCARMGDSKEVVRTQTTQALFRLLRPPTGNIVSPIAIAMLILRHVAPSREGEGPDSPGKGAASSVDKGARTGWLCRICALRDLAKEYSKGMVQQPGMTHPGEWLRLKDGLAHGDATVRYESARLYALVCKMHLRSLGDEAAQREGREAWVAALPRETPPKSMAQVRKLLKLPEEAEGAQEEGGRGDKDGGKLAATFTAQLAVWDVPRSLSDWAGCPMEVLAPLRAPQRGDEQAVANALKALGKAAAAFADTVKPKDGSLPDEAFANICRAIKQALSSVVGADRNVFLTAVELCQLSVTQLAPVLSGLDLNMGLAKTIPILMERTSLTGTSDVKVGVASDKLIQQLAKHPKVGCEAVTKMVISAVAKAQRPIRPLVLLRTLLSDFGLRLCAQRDVVMLLLGAVGAQLERLAGAHGPVPSPHAHAAPGSGGYPGAAHEDSDTLRPQLVGVLATCNQFSPETVRYCMSEVEPSHRKLIMAALQEAPNPRLVALGATAAEQSMEAHVAGSAVRAASRSRGLSPKPPGDPNNESPARSQPRHPLAAASGRSSRPTLPRADTDGAAVSMSRSSSMRQVSEASPSSIREASPRSHSRRRRRIDVSALPSAEDSAARHGSHHGLSEASTTASTDCAPTGSPTGSPMQRPPIGRGVSTGSLAMTPPDASWNTRSVKWGGEGAPLARPPAPMGLSTRLGNNDAQWRFGEEPHAAHQSRKLAPASKAT